MSQSFNISDSNDQLISKRCRSLKRSWSFESGVLEEGDIKNWQDRGSQGPDLGTPACIVCINSFVNYFISFNCFVCKIKARDSSNTKTVWIFFNFRRNKHAKYVSRQPQRAFTSQSDDNKKSLCAWMFYFEGVFWNCFHHWKSFPGFLVTCSQEKYAKDSFVSKMLLLLCCRNVTCKN